MTRIILNRKGTSKLMQHAPRDETNRTVWKSKEARNTTWFNKKLKNVATTSMSHQAGTHVMAGSLQRYVNMGTRDERFGWLRNIGLRTQITALRLVPGTLNKIRSVLAASDTQDSCIKYASWLCVESVCRVAVAREKVERAKIPELVTHNDLT